MIDFKLGVSLQPVAREHLMKTWLWRNDKRIWQWCRQYDALSWEQHNNWFDSLVSRKDVKMYSILANQQLVGVCGLTDIDLHNRRAEFSLYIGPEHQKQGFAEKALKTLFWHGFKNLGLNLIWGETFDKNPALRLFESLGMIKEGTRRDFYFRDGRFIDCHLVSVTEAQWSKLWRSDLVSE